MINKLKPLLLSSASVMLLASCGSQPEKQQTLASLDRDRPTYQKAKPKEQSKSKDDVKQAYYDYIKDAEKDDKLRVRAATRIAELELGLDQQDDAPKNDKEFEKTIRNTINLLEETLRDFPDSPNNDHVMYQLAKAHDQIGQGDQAIEILENMVTAYPDTQYFIEAKFRIAEYSFINGNYFNSEDAYTDVLRSPNSAIFFEKALFKRGWARFKQELYTEALNDFYDAVNRHGFANYSQLEKKEKAQFDEYFRAVGLAFSYMGGTDAIQEYYRSRGEHVYAYQTYRAVSDLLLKQERYSDAVANHESYIAAYPTGKGVIESGLAIVDIWKQAGLFNRYAGAFENFYQNYHSGARFWKTSAENISEEDRKLAQTSIRTNIIVMAAYNHKRYSKKPNSQNFAQTELWYKRYLKDHSAYAKQDQIYPLYAELLNKAGKYEQALPYYELAAFDGDIILDKDSAYATIFLTDQLFSQAPANNPSRKIWLDKHIRYTKQYADLYTSEPRTSKIIEHAVQLAFKDQRLEQAIELANLLPDQADSKLAHQVGLLKAQSYFNLKQFEDAEIMYQDLLVNEDLNNHDRQDLSNKLALSIYRQAEADQKEGQTDTAARNFLKVYRTTPQSELAATAVYDAIALFMSNNMWDEAIDYLNVFKREYPSHPYQSEVGKKLSLAYLKSNRDLEAAKEFEKLSNFVSSEEEKMAALWQAAKLYREKGDLTSAVRAYRQYSHNYKRPYAQNMEAMSILAEIYQEQGEREKRYFWLRNIANADQKAAKSNKTDRTRYVAANASYAMALLRMDDYSQIKLTHPLDKSLNKKKEAMQDSVKLFGRSAEYGHEDFVTNATYHIGEIYQSFAVSLMQSERPKGLNEDELEQYNILLEDQAFPFEDKAIELYETNMTRIAGGNFDAAIGKSLQQLQKLFPVRYSRPGKVELSVEQL